MMTPMRYVVLVLGLIVRPDPFIQLSAVANDAQISLHYLLSFTHDGYASATSLNRLKNSLGKSSPDYSSIPSEYYQNSTITPPSRKARAAFVVLARNGDLEGVLSSMKQMEDRFNKRYQYPWVFLNEEPFSDTFKQYAVYFVLSE